ncbi:MAG: MmgE/PrpD family protein, partial [Gammaproteobacteria bacterium]|nr:MmgE/PrpD family protein [Gammaproteobacteria bacterium]
RAKAFCLATDATGVAIQPTALPTGARQPCAKGHFFVVLADRDHVFFEYKRKHNSDAVCEMFRGFGGYILADAHCTYDALFRGRHFAFQRPYGSYVMENVLFKISYPAEFHSQTAVEAAMQLHQRLQEMGVTAADVDHIRVRTHEACIRIIDKKGPLANPADRDHCIQYMMAVPLLFGRLTAADYEDEVARDPRIDALRARIECVEDPQFTRDYLDPQKRSIANAVTVKLKDGRTLDEVVVEYPIGHRRRRQEGIPLLLAKFRRNLARRFPEKQQQAIAELSLDRGRLERTPVNEYVDLYVI